MITKRGIIVVILISLVIVIPITIKLNRVSKENAAKEKINPDYQKKSPKGKIVHFSAASSYTAWVVFEDGSMWEYYKHRGWKMHRKPQNFSGQTSE